MEFFEENLDNLCLNIENFSKHIGKTWAIPNDVLSNYLLSTISIVMTRTVQIRKEVTKLYLLDKIKYHNATNTSPCSKHIVITEGTLEEEIEARKALGILLLAEKDYNLRSTVIRLLRRFYPTVYNAVKKHDKRELTKRYLSMDEVTRKKEARLDASLYFYFSIYRSEEAVDQGFLESIIEDIKFFEFQDPMTRDISKELEIHKSEIQEIKALLKRDYGKINNYKDILSSRLKPIETLGSILENIFIINKLDINRLFSESNFLNVDEILLSYIKLGNKVLDPDLILQSLVNGIFIKSLINDYKKSRVLYFENNQVTDFEENYNNMTEENKALTAKLTTLEDQASRFDITLNTEINKLNKQHNSQIAEMQTRIKELESQLINEKSYRTELNGLREYIFEVTNDYTPTNSGKTLATYILNKKILIIGGAKEWRRKLREKYPELRSLHGFNDNFDTNILASYDYIFFYTGFMNHATYYRAMNFIRANQIKFGYLGKTNMDLVEEELLEELQKLDVK